MNQQQDFTGSTDYNARSPHQKRPKSVLQTQNRMAIFRAGTPPSSVPHASQTIFTLLKLLLWTLIVLRKYKLTVDNLSWLYYALVWAYPKFQPWPGQSRSPTTASGGVAAAVTVARAQVLKHSCSVIHRQGARTVLTSEGKW